MPKSKIDDLIFFIKIYLMSYIFDLLYAILYFLYSLLRYRIEDLFFMDRCDYSFSNYMNVVLLFFILRYI